MDFIVSEQSRVGKVIGKAQKRNRIEGYLRPALLKVSTRSRSFRIAAAVHFPFLGSGRLLQQSPVQGGVFNE
jgi:hypothetical protein